MISNAAQNIIKTAEGLKLTAYLCPAKIPTIGWGHTKTVKAADVGKKTITQAEAQRLLEADVAVFEAAVARLVKVKLTENQRGALVSWVYNLGEGNLAKSTLLTRINANAPLADIERSWLQWINSGGKPLKGLLLRRQAEVALWKQP
ncbi:lysozyme [Rhizobium sp. Leaf155]|nr:lysozyme [Rhizobium sp. Leaf155]